MPDDRIGPGDWQRRLRRDRGASCDIAHSDRTFTSLNGGEREFEVMRLL